MSEATNGLLQAHVIRLVPPCDPAVVSKRHYHDVDLQMIYVLKGWMKGEYDGQVVTMRKGGAWLQPPRIKHTVLDYSDDCELLEIIVPAEFETGGASTQMNREEKIVTTKHKYRVKAITRRHVLEATLAGSALVAAPAFLRQRRRRRARSRSAFRR